MTPNKSQEIFLLELKDQLRRYTDIRTQHNSKASSLIATASTISIIFAVFGTFIITEIASGYDIWRILLALVLIFEILITVWAIKSASDAYKARKYRQPIVYDNLWDKENDRVNDEVVSQHATAEPQDMYKNLILEYILCIKNHQEQNDMQVKDIESAQIKFYAALFSIPVFVVVAVVFTAVSGLGLVNA